MTDNKQSASIKRQVKDSVDRLLIGAGWSRREAASELTRLGVQHRRSVRTRGSLRRAAESELPDPSELTELIRVLKEETDPGVRSQIALALGQWGGEEAAAALGAVLPAEDADEEVQLHCVTALRTIGGETAATALGQAAASGTPAVREAAIAAIEELATGGQVDYTEGPDISDVGVRTRGVQAPQGAIRTLGPVRTKGAGRRATPKTVVDRIADALDSVRADDTASDYLRLRADEVLDLLTE